MSTCPRSRDQLQGSCTVPREDARLSYADAREDWEDAMRDRDHGDEVMGSLVDRMEAAYDRLVYLVTRSCVVIGSELAGS